MRNQFIILVTSSLVSISCSRAEPNRFTLRNEEITHVGGCHIQMINAAYHKEPPFVGLVYVCGLPESDLQGWPKGDPKWATHPTPPLGFTMNVGDCLILEETYYCVESIRAGEAAFKASFKKTPGHEALIRHIDP
jgi:hypothetical protein